MANKSRNKQPNATDKSGGMNLFDFLANIMNRVGTVGFVVIGVTIFVFKYASDSQKKDIINTWLLFKSDQSQFSFSIALLILGALFFVKWYHCLKMFKIKETRINELAKEKSELHSLMLNKRLNTSK